MTAHLLYFSRVLLYFINICWHYRYKDTHYGCKINFGYHKICFNVSPTYFVIHNFLKKGAFQGYPTVSCDQRRESSCYYFWRFWGWPSSPTGPLLPIFPYSPPPPEYCAGLLLVPSYCKTSIYHPRNQLGSSWSLARLMWIRLKKQYFNNVTS